MKRDADIIIAGSGLVGSTMALAFASTGQSVVIVDPIPKTDHQDPEFDGRGYALSLASQRLLMSLGVWSAVQDHSQPILEIKVSDGRPGQGPSPMVLEFDHAEIEEGPMGYMIEDRYLRIALDRAIESSDLIERISPDAIQSHQVESSGVSCNLASGRTVVSSLLVGCDGRTSGTATRAGIRRTGWGYGQTALVCAIEHAQPHNGTAHQFFMPSGPLAILPLPGNRSSIVWTETEGEAARIHALPNAEYLEELRPRFGSFLGQIGLSGKRFTYPLNLTLANSFYADRVALVGDAAHGVHPIAGQGLNAGLKDVAALAEVIALAARRGEDIGRSDVLARYQQWRRFDATTLAIATDGFNRLFSNDNSLLRLGRDIGMGLVNSLPGLRRNFIREAAGLTGELPKLLQGRAI